MDIKKSIRLYDYTIVFLVGASFSGKTSFAEKYFHEYEIVHNGKPDFTKTLQILDGNYLEADSRKELLRQAKNHNYLRTAIVFKTEVEELMKRNDGSLSQGFLEMQVRSVNNIQKHLEQEGFDEIYVITEDDNVAVERVKGNWDKRDLSGPFNIIGDVHGCYDALAKLVRKLGYKTDEEGRYYHSDKRTIIFTGDVVDRGDKSVETLKLIMKLVEDGVALMVRGNHDERLLRYLKGGDVEAVHGLETTSREMAEQDEAFIQAVIDFMDRLPYYLWLDKGSLVVVHAGIKREFLGKDTRNIREYCLYGCGRQEYDKPGFPAIEEWAGDYKDDMVVVFGHIPGINVYKIHNVYGVDTACVFGYYLSALRYPEMTVEQVRNRNKNK